MKIVTLAHARAQEVLPASEVRVRTDGFAGAWGEDDTFEPDDFGLSDAELHALFARRAELVRILRSRRWSDADSEDIAQAALVTAWRKREKFDRVHRGGPWAWLLVIARHEAMKLLDKVRGQASVKQRTFVAFDEDAADVEHQDVEATFDARRALARFGDLPAFVAAAERIERERHAASTAHARARSISSAPYGTAGEERAVVDYVRRRVLEDGARQVDVLAELDARGWRMRSGEPWHRPAMSKLVSRIGRAA